MCLEDPETLEARVPEALIGEKVMRLPEPFVFMCLPAVAARVWEARGAVGSAPSWRQKEWALLLFYWLPYLGSNEVNIYNSNDVMQLSLSPNNLICLSRYRDWHHEETCVEAFKMVMVCEDTKDMDDKIP